MTDTYNLHGGFVGAALGLISLGSRCGILALFCFLTSLIWPELATFAACSTFLVFCYVLWKNGSSALTNLTFVFLAVTVIILLSNAVFNGIFLKIRNLTPEDSAIHVWTVQYLGLAITAMVLGASLVKTRKYDGSVVNCENRLRCPGIYIFAALIPLLLNVCLYYLNLRGLDYVEIHKASLGPQKYILFLVFVTHASFIRLFGGWAGLSRLHKMALGLLVCLFLWVYVSLLPLRTNLFMFGMYSFYFFGGFFRWYHKVSIFLIGLFLFSWMAITRGGMDDSLKQMDIAQGAVEEMSFGITMGSMLPWAHDEVRRDGCAWGATYVLEMLSPEYSPSVRYVQDRAPLYAEAGGGYGFFYLAEMILNFGYFGALIGSCIFGIVLQVLSTTRISMVRSTILPALLGASFPLIRNDFMTTMKVPLYFVIACVLLDCVALYSFRLGKVAKISLLPSVSSTTLL